MSSRIDRMLKLIELADIELDKAAKTMAAIQEQYTQHSTQLESLISYEKEYAGAPANESMSMTLAQLQTRHAFGEKLRQAIIAQSSQVEHLEGSVEMARNSWLEKRKDLNALQRLLDKLKQRLQVKLNRQEQRMLDDLSAQKIIFNKINGDR